MKRGEKFTTAQNSTQIMLVCKEKNETPKSHEKGMQNLIQRLIPYSKSLQGSALHIAFERSKLMAMLRSTVMKKMVVVDGF
jgi:hypothetical protein